MILKSFLGKVLWDDCICQIGAKLKNWVKTFSLFGNLRSLVLWKKPSKLPQNQSDSWLSKFQASPNKSFEEFFEVWYRSIRWHFPGQNLIHFGLYVDSRIWNALNAISKLEWFLTEWSRSYIAFALIDAMALRAF